MASAKPKKTYKPSTRKRHRRRCKKQGRCVNCVNPAMAEVTMCESCWYKKRAVACAGSSKYADLLKEKMVEQNFRCYYTGYPLYPGINASLDHKLSIKNHPDQAKDLNNLVWCLRQINTMKHRMDDAAFIFTCKLIAERFS